jgi:hypothetical protein
LNGFFSCQVLGHNHLPAGHHHIEDYNDHVPPKFDAEHINPLQKYQWLIVQCNNHATPQLNKGSPKWTEAYKHSDFVSVDRRLFGAGRVEFFIGHIQGLAGNHLMLDMQDFHFKGQSLESYYDPHTYLLRGQGIHWCTALMRPKSHAITLFICHEIASESECCNRAFT